jgi:hypothetical protein
MRTASVSSCHDVQSLSIGTPSIKNVSRFERVERREGDCADIGWGDVLPRFRQ